MKNERTVKLTLKKAKEWYNAGGELKEVALQAYSEEELIDKPRSWEEFCRNYEMTCHEYYINGAADICSVWPSWNVKQNPQRSRNILPNREYAEAFLAMMQLMSLRHDWIHKWSLERGMIDDWKPDWRKTISCIVIEDNTLLTATEYTSAQHVLSFPTLEMAREFLDCFRDLIEQAKILI